MQEIDQLTTLAENEPLSAFLRKVITEFYLFMLLVKPEAKVEENLYNKIHDFISSEKKKYLIFSISNHSSDVDGISVFKAIEKKFPELTGKLVILVEKERWSDQKNKHELDLTVGSYILFNRNAADKAEFKRSLDEIKAAMDKGFALVFFSEGTRDEGAEEGNFVLNATTHLEKNQENGLPEIDSEGVMIVDASLSDGLREVFPKVPPGEEKKQRMQVIKKKIANIFNPNSWKRVSLTINDLIISRNEVGGKKSRGQLKNELKIVRSKRAKESTVKSEPLIE